MHSWQNCAGLYITQTNMTYIYLIYVMLCIVVFISGATIGAFLFLWALSNAPRDGKGNLGVFSLPFDSLQKLKSLGKTKTKVDFLTLQTKCGNHKNYACNALNVHNQSYLEFNKTRYCFMTLNYYAMIYMWLHDHHQVKQASNVSSIVNSLHHLRGETQNKLEH